MRSEGSPRIAALCVVEVVGHIAWPDREEGQRGALTRELMSAASAQCDAHGGRVVRAEGGAVVTAFDRVDDALAVGLHVVRVLGESDVVARAGTAVRAGVHAGGVEELPGDTLRGEVIDTAFRVCRLADDGAVVATEVVRRLVTEPSMVGLEDLGRFDLPEEPVTLRLYEVSPRAEPLPEGLHELLRRRLAPLQLLDRVGSDGKGDFYLVRDPRLHRTLVARVVGADLLRPAGARSRFLREVRIIATLSHPNVIGIHAVGDLPDGTLYYVMDHVEGPSLAERMASDVPVRSREGRRLLGDLAAGLEAAHSRGVVHGGLHPSAVLLDAESRRAIITDWGLHLPDRGHVTDTDATGVSPEISMEVARFMSPEQLAGDAVGAESDVYGAGLLVFEAVAGRGPFEGDTPKDLLLERLLGRRARLGDVDAGADPELDEALHACLAHAPQDRPTADALATRFRVDAGSILEWPTPGMEGALGCGMAPVINWVVGTHFWLLAVVLWAILSGGPATSEDVWAVGAVWCMLALVVSAFAFVWAAAGFLHLFSEGRRAAGMGYDLITFVDIVADTDGTTGMLLSGTHRFARRSRARRRLLVTLRRFGLLGPLALGCITPLVGAALVSGLVSPLSVAAWWLLAPLAVLLCRSRSWEAVLAGGRSRTGADGQDRSVVAGWYRTLALVGGRVLGLRRSWWARRSVMVTLTVLASVSLVVLGALVIAVGVRIFGGTYDYLAGVLRSLGG